MLLVCQKGCQRQQGCDGKVVVGKAMVVVGKVMVVYNVGKVVVVGGKAVVAVAVVDKAMVGVDGGRSEVCVGGDVLVIFSLVRQGRRSW